MNTAQNQTSAHPPCEVCGEPSVCVINNRGMCAEQAHIDAVMAKVFSPIHRLRRAFRRDHP